MYRSQWKASALFLTTILISILILIFVTPLSGKVLAQKTIMQCGVIPTDDIFQAAQSLVERYGVDICKQGKYKGEDTQIRAEMADILAPALGKVEGLIALSVEKLPRKSELASLNQLLDQITAQVEALEKQ